MLESADPMSNSAIRVSNTLINGLVFYAGLIGIQPDEALLGTQLTLVDLSNVDGRQPEELYDLIFFNCVRASQDDLFGLKLGQNLSLQQLGVLGFLMMNSKNFEDALKAYERFQFTLGESVRSTVFRRGSRARVEFQLFGGERTGQHRIESFFSAIKAAGRELTGRPLALLEVGLPFTLSRPASEYVDLLEVAPVFSVKPYLEFESFYLDLPIINSISHLNSTFEQQLNSQLVNSAGESLARRVVSEMNRRIGGVQDVSVREFSEHFGLSQRAFQLKLEEEGHSFRRLFDNVRSDLAIRFLQQGRPIAEVAYALGFAEPAAFQKAFKRWTGKTPGEARS